MSTQLLAKIAEIAEPETFEVWEVNAQGRPVQVTTTTHGEDYARTLAEQWTAVEAENARLARREPRRTYVAVKATTSRTVIE